MKRRQVVPLAEEIEQNSLLASFPPPITQAGNNRFISPHQRGKLSRRFLEGLHHMGDACGHIPINAFCIIGVKCILHKPAN